MSSGTEQDDLEQMLAASRELRSRYRAASQEQPSAQVDDAIRAHARRAVGARPRSIAAPFGASWRVPLSIAAVLVLSVTLTVMVTRQDRHVPTAESPPARDALSQGAPASAPAESSQQPQSQQPPQAAVPSATRQLSRDQVPLADTRAPQEAKGSASTEENAPERREKTRAAKTPEVQSSAAKDSASPELYQAPAPAPSLDESKLKKEAQPFPAAPAAPAAPSVPRAEPAPAAAPPAQTAVRAEAMREHERDQAVSETGAGQRGVVTGRQDAAKPSSANAADAQSNLKAEPSAAGSLEARGARQKQVAPATAGASAQSAPPPPAAPWESDPKAWLRHIETLVRDKHMSEARDSFKAFRQRYPAYPLPSEFPLREP